MVIEIDTIETREKDGNNCKGFHDWKKVTGFADVMVTMEGEHIPCEHVQLVCRKCGSKKDEFLSGIETKGVYRVYTEYSV